MKKSENKIGLEQKDIMSDIVIKLNENECEGIGMLRRLNPWRIQNGKKVWYKSCPQCGGEQTYTSRSAASWARIHAKICLSCKNSGVGNPFYGKSHTVEHRVGLSKKQKECSYRYKRSGHNPPKIQKVCKQCKNLYEVVPCRSGSKYCCYHCAWLDNYGFTWNKKSAPEKRMEEILQSLGVQYQYGYPLGGKIYDFYIECKKLLLEVDGIYWHGKGLTWDEMTPGQRKARKNDLVKNRIAHENGLKIIRIWEDEVESVSEYLD